jgi:hypothetical protein
MYRWAIYLQRQADGAPQGVLEYTQIYVFGKDEDEALAKAEHLLTKRTDFVENADAGGVPWEVQEFEDRPNPERLSGRID